MLCKHGRRDRSHAAGDWRYIRGFQCNCVKLHISTQLAIVVNVDTDVDNDTVVRYEICRDHGSLARSRDKDFRIPAGFLKILGLCMADGNSRILLKQQHRAVSYTHLTLPTIYFI